MIELITKRLVSGVIIVVLAITVVFFLMTVVGDPAVANLGPHASPDRLANYRALHGLDRPVLEQYFSYLGNLFAHGDLGRSIRPNGQPVMTVILTRLPRTVLLGTVAMGFELLFGLTLGILAAIRRNTSFDTAFMGLAFLGISIPSFLSGLLFLYVFSFRLAWFPIGGFGQGFFDNLYHALLPGFTLAIIRAATYARLMRSEMIDALRADFIRTAKAKGLRPSQVVLKHAARNALLPIVTMLGLSLPFLISGAIITEQIYNWPGMGRLLIESLNALDFPMILGVVLFAASAVQIGNLLADIAVGALDPRIRMRAKTSG